MSLNGQWIAQYSGTNTGTVVLDLDEMDDGFAGSAVAWDDNPNYPNSVVTIRTPSKGDAHELTGVPVVAIDNVGNLLTDATWQRLQASGVTMPKTADIKLRLVGDNLSMQWSTDIGTSGIATALASKTRIGEPSALVPLPVRSWRRFKEYVNSLEQKRYIFRGQESSVWRLRTSFHRTGRADLQRYMLRDLQDDLAKTFSALTQHVFDLSNPFHYAAFINLAQHHGYPTPMLDWTWSPYVAAFFAYRRIPMHGRSRRRIRIYKLDIMEWNRLPRADKLFPFVPNVTVLNPLAFGNSRAIPQQSLSTTANVDDIESYIAMVEATRGKKYLEAVDLPASGRNFVMKELALMGVTAGALFPGLDGACESLKERNF